MGMSKFAPFEYAFSPILLNLLATTFYGYFKVVLSLKKFLFAFVLPRGQFQILGFENFHSSLCTGACKKIVYMPEILVSCHALR